MRNFPAMAASPHAPYAPHASYGSYGYAARTPCAGFVGFWRRSRAGMDRPMLAAVAVLAVVGLMLLPGAGAPVASRLGLEPLHFFYRQALMMAMAAMLLMTTASLGRRGVFALSFAVLAVSVVLTLFTVLAGPEVNGAQRWLRLFGVSVQPVEFVKPAFAVVFAWLLIRLCRGGGLAWLVAGCLLTFAVITLALAQPDFGQGVILAAIGGMEVFLIGAPWGLVVLLLGCGIALAGTAYAVLPHVARRVESFFSNEGGYQLERAFQSFHEGGLSGRGLGQGVVRETLPDAHSDFIFAVAAEEFGLGLCLVILAAVAVVVIRGVLRSVRCGDAWAALACGGLLTNFAAQAFIHTGSVTGLIPAKGMTLPFVSYGGSALMAMALNMGFVLALTRTTRLWPGGERS